MMNINDFDYNLPKELIAQKPAEQRDMCRLMVLDREKKTIEQRIFRDVLDYLKPGDCLVMNDSKVIPASQINKQRMERIFLERFKAPTICRQIKPSSLASK